MDQRRAEERHRELLPSNTESTQVINLQKTFQANDIYPAVIVYVREIAHLPRTGEHDNSAQNSLARSTTTRPPGSQHQGLSA
jgi:hypothetical protein